MVWMRGSHPTQRSGTKGPSSAKAVAQLSPELRHGGDGPLGVWGGQS